jgi:hypothetical protein
MTGQILSVMEAQEAFQTSINILSDKISLLMGLIADKTMVDTNKDTLNLCQRTPNSSPSTTSGSARACINSEETISMVAYLLPDATETALAIREEDGNVLSMKSIALKSLSSTESEKF